MTVAGLAINVGANTNEPGFRGPVWPDGSFEFLPIPESEPTAGPVPTYGDLAPALETPIPERIRETPVHLDPEFAEYPCCERYTYGDDHGVKAGPLSGLAAGDVVFFYATLRVRDRTRVANRATPTGGDDDGQTIDWLPPEWGAFLIGQFRLARDPVTDGDYRALSAAERTIYENNAHLKRDPFDARVLLQGTPTDSRLYETVTPLSQPSGGTDAGPLVTELSEDSGRGPWWRRPLAFDDAATERLLSVTATPPSQIRG